MVSFYRGFLKNFSQVAYPLIKLANKANSNADAKENFMWTEQHEAAFKRFKQLIRNHAGNYLPDYTKPFSGTSGASTTNV